MTYKETLKTIKALFKTQELSKAMEVALLLRKNFPRDKTLHKWIKKINRALIREEKNARIEFIETGIKKIKAFRAKKEYESALKGCTELLEIAPNDEKIKKMETQSKVDYIEEKLHSPLQVQLKGNQDYEKLYLFYQKLRKVFPEYKKLQALIQEAEQRAIEADRARKKVFTEQSLQKLDGWFREGKFEDVIRGTQELMAYTHHGHSAIKKLMIKAKKANRKEIEIDTLNTMLEQQAILEREYNQKIGRVIKI